MNTVQKINAKLKLSLQRIVFTQVNKYNEVVWLIGTGRSGTTWCSSLINYKGNYREVFEPLHPTFFPEASFLRYHEYVRPGTNHERLEHLLKKIFSGQFSKARTDKENRGFRYENLLVKDIFANLMAKYVSEKFPNVRPVLLIRHPFAVAYSVYQKRNWSWMTDARDFLQQEELMEDYLSPFKKLIEEVGEKGDYIENQILIWCVLTYVPLLQFQDAPLHVLFYEELLKSPDYSISQLQDYLHPDCSEQIAISEEIINQPSWVTEGDKDEFTTNDFEGKLSPSQLGRGLEIIAAFGLDELYTGQTPNRAAIKQIQKR